MSMERELILLCQWAARRLPPLWEAYVTQELAKITAQAGEAGTAEQNLNGKTAPQSVKTTDRRNIKSG